jgi:hypothetical protein
MKVLQHPTQPAMSQAAASSAGPQMALLARILLTYGVCIAKGPGNSRRSCGNTFDTCSHLSIPLHCWDDADGRVGNSQGVRYECQRAGKGCSMPSRLSAERAPSGRYCKNLQGVVQASLVLCCSPAGQSFPSRAPPPGRPSRRHAPSTTFCASPRQARQYVLHSKTSVYGMVCASLRGASSPMCPAG